MNINSPDRTWSLILLLSNWIFLILKSIPIVVMKVGEKESLAYLRRRQVFPTPLSPIISNLICISKALSLPAIFRVWINHRRSDVNRILSIGVTEERYLSVLIDSVCWWHSLTYITRWVYHTRSKSGCIFSAAIIETRNLVVNRKLKFQWPIRKSIVSSDYCRIRTYARISQWISSPPP